MTATITIDDLVFEVRSSPRRKTLQLTVDRGGELILAAPDGTGRSVLEEFVREKKFWLYSKLAQKEALHKRVTPKEFVSGESFPYLGRYYRLLVVDKQDQPLKLDHGRFRLVRSEVGRGTDHLIRWYSTHGDTWLEKRVPKFTRRVGVEPRAVRVRSLGYRWASCSKGEILNFNWATLMLPPSIIDYLIVHELVHMKHRDHTPDFWLAVERAMPDYQDRKVWLAERGGELAEIGRSLAARAKEDRSTEAL